MHADFLQTPLLHCRVLLQLTENKMHEFYFILTIDKMYIIPELFKFERYLWMFYFIFKIKHE